MQHICCVTWQECVKVYTSWFSADKYSADTYFSPFAFFSRGQKFNLCFSFSPQALLPGEPWLPVLPSQAFCSLGFLFLLWCLSLSLPEGLFSFSMRWCFPSLNVFALTSFVAPAWVSFMAKPHERLQTLLSFLVAALNLTY